ncbi:hypothetical protein A5657_17695 [Mycobacterium kubicae]|nr:hypothetical protein A5657_17695 [Mycobacterium kubicae]
MRWPARLSALRSDLEGQPRTGGVADVDALPVVDVDDGHAVAVDVGPVQGAVVNGQPAALVEAKYQVGARDARIWDTQVGVQVTSDDHLVTGLKGDLGPVMSDGQRRRGWSTHDN